MTRKQVFKRPKAKREHDLVVAAELYCQGKSQMDIAAALGISQQQVSNDLRQIHKEWEKARIRSYTELQNKELAKIDLAEKQAWEAWWRSCEIEEVTTAKSIGGRFARDETGIRRKTKVGDPRFLELALKCVDKRCAILGLDAPTRATFAGVIGGGTVDKEVLASGERAKALAAILEECGAAGLLRAQNPPTDEEIKDAVVVEVERE